jgi:hypothetical protein
MRSSCRACRWRLSGGAPAGRSRSRLTSRNTSAAASPSVARLPAIERASSSQGAGWEFVHVAIDDHSRVVRADILPDQKKESAVAFLGRHVAYFRSLGITVERVMTDNGSCYLSKAFARACKQLAVKHIRIKPYTPQPTAKPNASSRLRLENGPMPLPSSTQSSDTPPCPLGSIVTTGTGLMLASHASHRSADSV